MDHYHQGEFLFDRLQTLFDELQNQVNNSVIPGEMCLQVFNNFFHIDLIILNQRIPTI